MDGLNGDEENLTVNLIKSLEIDATISLIV